MSFGYRAYSVIAAAILVGLAGAPPAGAAAAETPTINCSSYLAAQDLNIRSKPSTGGKIVDVLRKGERVCGTIEKGDSYTACNKTKSIWVGFYWKPTGPGNYGYVAATCMKG